MASVGSVTACVLIRFRIQLERRIVILARGLTLFSGTFSLGKFLQVVVICFVRLFGLVVASDSALDILNPAGFVVDELELNGTTIGNADVQLDRRRDVGIPRYHVFVDLDPIADVLELVANNQICVPIITNSPEELHGPIRRDRLVRRIIGTVCEKHLVRTRSSEDRCRSSGSIRVELDDLLEIRQEHCFFSIAKRRFRDDFLRVDAFIIIRRVWIVAGFRQQGVNNLFINSSSTWIVWNGRCSERISISIGNYKWIGRGTGASASAIKSLSRRRNQNRVSAVASLVRDAYPDEVGVFEDCAGVFGARLRVMRVSRVERVDLDQILEFFLLEARHLLSTVCQHEHIRVVRCACAHVQSIDRSGSCADFVRRTSRADDDADDECEHGQCCQDSR